MAQEADWGEAPEKSGRDPQVVLALKALEDATERVDHQAHRLMSGVERVLVPAEPEPDSANVKAVSPSMAPLAEELHGQAEKLRGVASRLASAVARLDV
jgi:hypothetical protein